MLQFYVSIINIHAPITLQLLMLRYHKLIIIYLNVSNRRDAKNIAVTVKVKSFSSVILRVQRHADTKIGFILNL